MRETTVLNNIAKLVDKLNYKSLYIEIDIGKVDAVYFMKGWEKARGCKIEHEVAVQYEKQVFYEN